MIKDNGLKSRVRLQQHVWSKNIELDGESFQSNATTGMIANSKLFFYCDAQVKNKKIVGTTVNLQPLYSINWTNDWPCIVNSNLLRIKNFDYKTAINKKIKLQINHTLSTENRSKSLEPSTSSHKTGSPVITKAIYNQGALNLDLLGNYFA